VDSKTMTGSELRRAAGQGSGQYKRWPDFELHAPQLITDAGCGTRKKAKDNVGDDMPPQN